MESPLLSSSGNFASAACSDPWIKAGELQSQKTAVSENISGPGI